jgi:uncharacterized protein (TIGR04255 family)
MQAMDSPNRTLPDYAKPPVNEVVMGVQFTPLQRFEAVHPGLYWQNIRGRYPKFSVQPPLATVIESFGTHPNLPPSIQATFLQTPPLPRCWFLDESGNHLIQVQPDKFLLNWRKVTGAEEYPHYNTIFPDFKKEWAGFLSFINVEALGDIELNHWEVTYVNHIHQGDCWNDFGDIDQLFPILSNKSLPTCLQKPERFSLSLTYCYPDQLSRLHVELTPAYRRSDNALLLRFTFTARGRLVSNDENALYAKFNFGHEIIVNSFTDLTSSNAHKFWKRKIQND